MYYLSYHQILITKMNNGWFIHVKDLSFLWCTLKKLFPFIFLSLPSQKSFKWMIFQTLPWFEASTSPDPLFNNLKPYPSPQPDSPSQTPPLFSLLLLCFSISSGSAYQHPISYDFSHLQINTKIKKKQPRT